LETSRSKIEYRRDLFARNVELLHDFVNGHAIRLALANEYIEGRLEAKELITAVRRL